MPKRVPTQPPQEEEYISEEEAEAELNNQYQQPAQLPPMPEPPARVVKPRQQAPPRVPQIRYTGFVQQAREGVADAETGEVIASDVWDAFADVITRLERIERTLGSMMS